MPRPVPGGPVKRMNLGGIEEGRGCGLGLGVELGLGLNFVCSFSFGKKSWFLLNFRNGIYKFGFGIK